MDKNIKDILLKQEMELDRKLEAAKSAKRKKEIGELNALARARSLANIGPSTVEINKQISKIKDYVDEKQKKTESLIGQTEKSVLAQIEKESAKNAQRIMLDIIRTNNTLDDKVKAFNRSLDGIRKTIENLNVLPRHNQLQGISPDDHHKELHSIETHPGLKATTDDLNTLTDGSNADRLHTHKEKPLVMSGGIPQAAILNLMFQYIGGTEVLVGLIDGANNVYTVSHVPKWITHNGKSLYEDEDYTRVDLQITLTLIPEAGDILHSHYTQL
jgi:hypothetical protein